MIAACRSAGVRLGVSYYRRFYPVVARIRQLLASGAIGQPIVAQINAFERFDPEADHPRRWLLDPQLAGGGPMFDFGCHRLELLVHLFGAVAHASGQVSRAALQRDVEDTAIASLRFARGALATVTVTHAAFEPQDTLDIYATSGSLHVANLNGGDVRLRTADGEQVESHPPAANLHAPLVAEFLAAVADGRAPAVSGETGRLVAEIETQIYETAIS
jgi:predicted dehydrogenase